MAFDGIDIDMRRFFLEISMNSSSKEWFEENRSRYEKNVRDPLRALAAELSATMLDIDDRFDTRPSRVVARIRRDNRFTKDKSLYRDHLWLAFRQSGKRISEGLTMYVGFSRDTVDWGMGFYKADPKEMAGFREAIKASPNSFREVFYRPRLIEAFDLDGEYYKRCPVDTDGLDEDLKPFMYLKNFGIFHCEPYSDAVYNGEIAETLKSDFLEMKPLYDFIVRAVENASNK